MIKNELVNGRQYLVHVKNSGEDFITIRTWYDADYTNNLHIDGFYDCLNKNSPRLFQNPTRYIVEYAELPNSYDFYRMNDYMTEEVHRYCNKKGFNKFTERYLVYRYCHIGCENKETRLKLQENCPPHYTFKTFDKLFSLNVSADIGITSLSESFIKEHAMWRKY